MPRRLVVGQRTLDPLTEVRILAGQPGFTLGPPTNAVAGRPDPPVKLSAPGSQGRDDLEDGTDRTCPVVVHAPWNSPTRAMSPR
jgi:hypothetical protein